MDITVLKYVSLDLVRVRERYMNQSQTDNLQREISKAIEAIQAMIEGGIGVNDWTGQYGGTNKACIHLYHNRHPEIQQWILDHGGDINLPDSNGWTPLMYAMTRSDVPKTLMLLLERGADITRREPTRGGTALDFAIDHDRPPFLRIRTLLQWGANSVGPLLFANQIGAHEYARSRLILLVLATPRCLPRARHVPLSLLPVDLLRRLMVYLFWI